MLRIISIGLLGWLWAGSLVADEAPGESGRDYPAHWQRHHAEEPVLGSQLHWVETGNPDAPALLLVHGLGENGLLDWREIIELLRQQYRVVALDLPGFGDSRGARGDLSPRNYSRVLQWLMEHRNLDEVHLAGHSMGAAVALMYAARHPDSLSRLTLVDVAGILHRATFVKSMTRIDRDNFDFLPGFMERTVSQVLEFGDSLVEKVNLLPDFTALLRQNDAAWDAIMSDRPNTNAALTLVHTNYSGLPEAVDLPTRIVWGAEDSVAPLRTGYLLQHLLPDSELRIFADAGHVPMQSHPRELAALLASPVNPSPALGDHSPGKDDLYCRGETGPRYTGAYRRVILAGCVDVVLENLQAAYVEIHDSSVRARNLRVRGGKVALRMERSRLQLTAGSIQGETGVAVDASRLDMAGVRVTGEDTALQVDGASVIIASLSEARSGRYRGSLHGLVRARDAAAEALSELQSGQP